MIVALSLERGYDPTILYAFLVGAVYPLAFWILAAAAVVHSQIVALLRGPSRERVVWDIPRERLDDTPSQDR
jgi:hypothetical protein